MIDLRKSVAYDLEIFPNYFSLDAEEIFGSIKGVFQICPWRDDRHHLRQWFEFLAAEQIPMIGFNNLGYDYLIIHEIFKNPFITNEQLYALSKSIINQPFNAPRKMIWESDRFAPQIDLMKVHHFDNKAKTTSLKALEINMRSPVVLESELSFDEPITQHDAETIVLPYNRTDTRETKQFALHSMEALEFRVGTLARLEGDVMNFNDTKIGEKILEQRLGPDLCYQFTPRYPGDNNPRRSPRQTIRSRIALSDIIFPYVSFQHPEFQRVLSYMQSQVLTPDDLDDPDAPIKTKGVFKGLTANVGGIDFSFGTGGIHGSVLSKRFVATDEWLIRDIDVASLYPSVAIVNRLAPAHLGAPFVDEYARLPEERREWQAKKGKKCVEANSMKLAGNGTYGKSNSPFSVFYDPQFTMTITINGQLMLCMLAEWLLPVPTLQLIAINTDGITYRIHRDHLAQAQEIEKRWQEFTLLKLEDAAYSRMFIRDVNSYIAETTDGSLKLKGCYWFPGMSGDYFKDISSSQPPAWHKDLGNLVSIKAAVAAMVHGIDPEQFVRFHTDPFDFMLRVKVDRASHLMLGGREIQGTSRYYVALQGEELVKVSPPVKGARVGDYKRANGVPDDLFKSVSAEIGPGVHDPRIHTKNKSKYEIREMTIEAGWKVRECNDAATFRFDNINYEFYVSEARKLLIG